MSTTLLKNLKNKITHQYLQKIINQIKSGDIEYKKLNFLLKQNYSVALAAMQFDEMNILHVSYNLLKNEDFIKEIIPLTVLALYFADDKIKHNKPLILEKLKEGHLSLRDLEPILLNDRDIILEAAKK